MSFQAFACVVAVAGLLAGFLLLLGGKGLRRRRGLANAATVDLDTQTMISKRHGLAGRPDRLIREGGFIIPEEWKSSHQLRPWHVVQLGVYFLLVEERYRQRPPYGYVVCGDGRRHRIANDDALRAKVLELAGRIRSARAAIDRPIAVRPERWQCRPCGVRHACRQARL
jgi:CRISPR-associated exonuclease Cas4